MAVLGRARVCPHPPPLPLPGDPRRSLTHFSQDNTSHYDTFLLDDSEERLYVGARDRLLALAVGTPGTIHATASVSSSGFWEGWGSGGGGGALRCASVSPFRLGRRGLAQQLWRLSLPAADRVGTDGAENLRVHF